MQATQPGIWQQIFTRRMLICIFTGFTSGLPLYFLINLGLMAGICGLMLATTQQPLSVALLVGVAIWIAAHTTRTAKEKVDE